MWAKEHDRKRLRRCRFSIGSAPLTSITKIDAQIRGDETRHSLKIPGVSPWRLPRALLCSRPAADRVVVEALPTSPRPVSV